jgi:uncharacterized protein YbbC (DUF1343 family)
MYLFLLLLAGMMLQQCKAQHDRLPSFTLHEALKERAVVTGAERTAEYLPLLQGKTVAAVCNHTSMVGTVHLIDTLLACGIRVKKIFAPEHGFRGEAAAGQTIKDSKDKVSGLPIISLYGNKKKPSVEDLTGIEIVIFDIQDVGARFYTYISTLSYVMEACAEKNIPLIILDRPNPNGHFVDGPVLKKGFESFVGLHPVPVVHGMTVGEYARMVNAEGWLKGGIKCQLKVIPCLNYDHLTAYILPVPPSPNLPNMASVYLYPSLCFFEGTPISVGRGTDYPFQVIGFPGFRQGDIEFVPQTIKGIANNPPYENQLCQGIDLREFGKEYMKNYRGLYLYWLLAMYESYPDKDRFFTPYFNKLAGNDILAGQIKNGMSEEEIKKSWQEDLIKFKAIRRKYLLYPDFE